MTLRGTATFLILALALLPAHAGDRPTMVEIEAATERLAYRLLDLAQALQKGDAETRDACFDDNVQVGGFPPRAGDAEPLPLGMRRVTWQPGEDRAGPAALSDVVALAGTPEFVMLKPKASLILKVRMLYTDAKLRVVGRRADGTRVWLRGVVALMSWAHRDSPRILRLELKSLETIEAPTPVFADVTKSAGIECDDPAVLDHPTLGLAAYGAAAGDIDNDGRIDLFVTAHDGNRVLRNRGDGRFETMLAPSPHQATAPLLLDHDNDGDLDVFLSANGPQMLLENRLVPDGKLRFVDVSRKAGVAAKTIGFSVAAGDVNGDGRPDLYVAAYNNYGPVAPDSWIVGGNGLPNLFFVSTPGGGYEEAAKKWGVADARWSYGAQFCDVDGDGRLDLYVANDFGGGNALFVRRGDRFVDEAEARGVRDDGYAMGVSFGDYDNDGLVDLHVTRMSSTAGRRILARFDDDELPVRPTLLRLSAGNGLYKNLGAGRFREVTDAAGPFPAGWAWGGGFLDIDNDGREDLFTPNGHLSGAAAKDT